MNEQALSRALAARLEEHEHGQDPTQGVLPLASTADASLVDALADLAAGLEALPKPPAPSAAFRGALAERIAGAPAPSSLATSPKQSASTSPSTASDPTVGHRAAQQVAAQHRAASPSAVAPPTTRDLSRALDEFLGRLAAGEAPWVARDALGAAGEELAPLLSLATALRDTPSAPKPDPAFRAALAAQLADAPPPRSLATPARPGMGVLRRLWRSTAFTAAAAATVFLFVAAGVTYASADALPGQPLYPVKRTAERTRLWLSTESQSLALHIDYANRRLSEALYASEHAGDALADFSREVTAALAATDRAMAAGAAREPLTAPLLTWLLDARETLVLQRASLPPTAWRVALAQVDAAIHALRDERPLGRRPVPRLDDPVAVLAMRADATFDYRWAYVTLPPIGTNSALGVIGGLPGDGAADDGASDATGIAAVGRAGRDANSLRSTGALARNGLGPGGTGSTPADPPTSVGAAPGNAAPPAQPVAPPDDGGTGGDPPAPGPGPGPTDAPSNPPPTRESRPKPDPATAEPTKAPPTATTVPTTEPPAQPTTAPPTGEPTLTAAPTSEPTALPTNAPPTPPPAVDPTPLPTATTSPVLPTALEVVCTPNTLLPAGRARCQLEMNAPLPPGWAVEWLASLGTIREPHPDHPDDARFAEYEATNSLQGVEKVYATVSATLRDNEGNETVGTTIIYIVPRLNGEQNAGEQHGGEQNDGAQRDRDDHARNDAARNDADVDVDSHVDSDVGSGVDPDIDPDVDPAPATGRSTDG